LAGFEVGMPADDIAMLIARRATDQSGDQATRVSLSRRPVAHQLRR
jgi:hypothetical protein